MPDSTAADPSTPVSPLATPHSNPEGRKEMDPFTVWLSQPCDLCDRTATHNQNGWRLCNEHLDPDLPAFARND